MRVSGALRLLGAAVIPALLLGACDDGSAARAEEAANWLRAYTKTHPPNLVWRATDVYVSDTGNVVMEVLVLSPKQAAEIKARRKIAKVLIVQLACPPAGARVWKILDGDQSLWINLNGADGVLAGATCKH
ncbi:MAG: hypothetical protein ACE5FR_12535 [Rhodospirillales bacterium]